MNVNITDVQAADSASLLPFLGVRLSGRLRKDMPTKSRNDGRLETRPVGDGGAGLMEKGAGTAADGSMAFSKPASAGRTRPHVLVIDDVPEDCRNLVVALRSHDMRTSIATNGWQGFQAATNVVPELILLDLYMPKMDGLAVCRLLKESEVTRRIPIIFVSRGTSVTERVNALTQGAVDYITKPYEPREVVARVLVHLGLEPRAVAGVPEVHNTTSDEVILRAAMTFIRERFDSLPPLNEIAHQVGTYDKKLSMLFRRHLGATVFSWIREQRLLKSSELLQSSDMSVQDIASHVGFRDSCNFITAFREHMGITPLQYRKAVREREDTSDTVF